MQKIYLILILIISSFCLKAMDKIQDISLSKSEIIKTIDIEAQNTSESCLQNLPNELKEEIVGLIRESDITKITENIVNLSLVNKNFNGIINGHNFIGKLIFGYLNINISKLDYISFVNIYSFVVILNLSSAYDWLAQFLNKNSTIAKGVKLAFPQIIRLREKPMISIALKNKLIDVNGRDYDDRPFLFLTLPYMKKPYEQNNRSFEIANLFLSQPDININATIGQKADTQFYENSRPVVGNGLLHIAVLSRDITLLRFLLNQPNINVNLRNTETSQTPLALAKELIKGKMGNNKKVLEIIIELLEDAHMANVLR